jgi:hypothetical protein
VIEMMNTPRQVKRNEKMYQKKGKNRNKKLAVNYFFRKIKRQILPETNKIVYNLKIPWIYSRSFQTIERDWLVLLHNSGA